jgi:hypothetical protein
MKTDLLLFFPVIFALLNFSCSNSGSTTLNEDSLLKQGASYFFQMSDGNNQPLAEGKMKIVYKKNLIISGIYELTKVYNDSAPGLNTMKDTFSGKESKDDNAVYLNMNPKISDNNIIFEFNVSNNKIVGRWYYSTFLGKKAEGKLSGKEIAN